MRGARHRPLLSLSSPGRAARARGPAGPPCELGRERHRPARPRVQLVRVTHNHAQMNLHCLRVAQMCCAHWPLPFFGARARGGGRPRGEGDVAYQHSTNQTFCNRTRHRKERGEGEEVRCSARTGTGTGAPGGCRSLGRHRITTHHPPAYSSLMCTLE